MPVSFMLYDDPPSALQERDPNISATKDANSVPNGAIYKLPWGTGLDDLRNGEDLDKLSKQRISKTGIQKASKASREERNLEGWPDLAHIHLDGEENEQVPIYDTCNDVRTKIREHIKKYKGVSQAQLSREFSELMPNNKVSPRHVTKFLDFKGPRGGGHSPAFYGAYVYFEKLRIHQNKKKSKKREEMEGLWSKEGGFPREGSHNMRMTLPMGEGWWIDKNGCIGTTMKR